jgi:alkylation response protein AidB-like acyl-CoA dehydrogenase
MGGNCATLSRMTYTPPIKDQLFILNNLIGLEALQSLPHQGELDSDLIEAVLEEAAKFARDVLAPLNWSGDQQGTKRHENGAVTTAEGWKEAYKAFCDGGWNAVPFAAEHGGQGLPWTLAFCMQEMWQGANMSFGLCPLLNQGAIEAIEAHGSESQKDTYLPEMIAGTWTGTMNLTEPQAGSDLSVIKTKADPAEDGSYRIFGQKIYITYGEHDLTENIIHLVLARLPDAPEGVKGISLFIVPKLFEDGSRNDVKCTGLEHKLGIHASPTCTMQFGDDDGAVGYLVGEANQGLKYMFTMMNNARLSVGLQGVAVSERALQAARHYAAERVQGGVTIDTHADVKRMLMTMDSLTQAGRSLTIQAANYLDLARSGDALAQLFVDLLTPIVKSWCTDNALEVTSLGVQIHGGMGFIEETGAAQHYRDARILPIYEGTNGIQAMDLVFRKVMRDQGDSAFQWLKAHDMFEGVNLLHKATQHLLSLDTEKAGFIAMPYLNLFGVVAGHVALQKQMEVIDTHHDPKFIKQKKDIADFYHKNILPRAQTEFAIIMQG